MPFMPRLKIEKKPSKVKDIVRNPIVGIFQEFSPRQKNSDTRYRLTAGDEQDSTSGDLKHAVSRFEQ